MSKDALLWNFLTWRCNLFKISCSFVRIHVYKHSPSLSRWRTDDVVSNSTCHASLDVCNVFPVIQVSKTKQNGSDPLTRKYLIVWSGEYQWPRCSILDFRQPFLQITFSNSVSGEQLKLISSHYLHLTILTSFSWPSVASVIFIDSYV